MKIDYILLHKLYTAIDNYSHDYFKLNDFIIGQLVVLSSIFPFELYCEYKTRLEAYRDLILDEISNSTEE